MCKICEDHDDLFEAPLFHPTVHLGFSGELKMWVYVDAYNQQMVMHVLNPGTGNISEYSRVCNFCPVCGRDFSKAGYMALIKCPECGKEISDRADKCIHCGYPLRGEPPIYEDNFDEVRDDDYPEDYDDNYAEDTYEPPVLTTKWVLILSLMPLLSVIIRFVFGNPVAALVIPFLLNFVFLILDFIEVGKDEENNGAWIYTGVLLVPVYIFLRGKKIERNLKHFFIWLVGAIIYIFLAFRAVDANSTSNYSTDFSTQRTATVTTDAASYQDIYNKYILKMQNESVMLQEEFKNEAKNNTEGLSGLANIVNNKISVLASIYNDGVGEMAKISLSTGNYDEYESWSSKLYEDGYSKECDKLYDLYSGYSDDGESSISETTNKSYEEIYNEYVTKLQEATPGLIDDFLAEAPNNTEGASGLLDLYQEKSGKILDIYQEGAKEMLDAYHKHSSGVYTEFDEWRDKLYDVFDEERDKIYKAFDDYRDGV